MESRTQCLIYSIEDHLKALTTRRGSTRSSIRVVVPAGREAQKDGRRLSAPGNRSSGVRVERVSIRLRPMADQPEIVMTHRRIAPSELARLTGAFFESMVKTSP